MGWQVTSENVGGKTHDAPATLKCHVHGTLT